MCIRDSPTTCGATLGPGGGGWVVVSSQDVAQAAASSVNTADVEKNPADARDCDCLIAFSLGLGFPGQSHSTGPAQAEKYAGAKNRLFLPPVGSR